MQNCEIFKFSQRCCLKLTFARCPWVSSSWPFGGSFWRHFTMKALPSFEALGTIAGLIPQSLHLQTQVTLASQSWCHKPGQCAKSCARRSVCFHSQKGRGASIHLFSMKTCPCVSILTIKQPVYSVKNITIVYDIGILLWQHVSLFL